MKIFFKFLTILVYFNYAFARTYQLDSITTQLFHADGVIEGELVSKASKLSRNSEIVTEYVFKVEKFAGLGRNEILNKNYFKLIVPGGNWLDETYKIPNVPDFYLGEVVVLIVSKGEQGFYLYNLSQSTFVVHEKYGQRFLISKFDANYSLLDQILYDDFLKTVEEVYHKGFLSYRDGKIIYLNDEKWQKDNKLNRVVASVNHKNTGQDQFARQSVGIFWSSVLFAFLCFVSALLRRRQR